MKSRNSAIEAVVIDFYREEIRQRYRLDHVRRFKEFDSISDETIAAVRDFILERIYPTKDVRDKLDAAFDRLASLLRSPKRRAPLLRTAFLSMLMLGPQLPAAITAGIATVDAFTKTHDLEIAMMAAARNLEISPRRAGDRQEMLRVIAGVPEASVRDLVAQVIALFEALSNVKMLAGLLRLMERCLRAMESRPDIYDIEEREGLTYAFEVLRGGHDLFSLVKKKDFPQFLEGIEKIELAWYESVCDEVKRGLVSE